MTWEVFKPPARRRDGSSRGQRRVHLRSTMKEEMYGRPMPACTFTRSSQTKGFQLTDDPAEVTCFHCKTVIREAAK